jgi:hypothetical protein
MSRQNRISLGDVAKVRERLAARGSHTWNRILKLLDLPLELPSGDTSEVATPEPIVQTEVAARNLDVDRDDHDVPPASGMDRGPVFAPGHELSVRDVTQSLTRPSWSGPANLIADAKTAPASLGPAPALFVPGQERPLITAIAIALAETGDLDEERLVETIARHEPIQHIPRRRRPTSRFGVQLLVDWGPRLESMRQDQQSLIATTLRTVGAHRVEILRFSEFPHLAGPGTRRTWRPYEPPTSGTVVLILSDLGLGWLGTLPRTHTFDDWAEWARRVESAGARPVALVPHGPEHWPDQLRHHLTLIHWDRTTTVSRVRGMGDSSAGRRR